MKTYHYLRFTLLKWLAIVVLLTLGLDALAQDKSTISGYVKDAATGEDLLGATVLVEELGSGTVTNLYGFYSLTLPKAVYNLKVTYVGYDVISQTIDLNEDIKLNVCLPLALSELEEIVITDKAENQNVVSTEMSVQRLESQTIKDVPSVLGEPDVLKSIQLLPGVTSVADGASGFNVRGGSADQNLILLDEGILYNASHLLGLYSVVNPDAIKDVILYKGGIPSRYGGRLSSVLDIRQREGNNQQFEGEGGIGLVSARLLAEGPIVKDKGSFMVAGRRSYGDAFLALAGNDNVAYFYDLNVKANYNINEKNRVFLSGYFGRDKFELGNIFSNGWGNATSTLRWNHLFSDKLFANFSAVYSNYDYSIDNLATGSEFNKSSNIITYDVKANFDYYINDRNSLAFGASNLWYDFRPGLISPLEGSGINEIELDRKYARETSAYVSYLTNFGALSLEGGLRVSYFDRIGEEPIQEYENDQPVIYNSLTSRYEPGVVTGETRYASGRSISNFLNWEPRFTASYVLDPRQSIKLSYNRTTQYVHLISNTTAPTPLDVWLPSGPYLEPQLSDQIAIGYFRNFKDNAYEASVEAYYKDMQNQLDFVDGADLLTNNFIETAVLSGDGRAYGLEAFIKKNSGRLTGWVSYTLARAERRIQGLGEGDPGINRGTFYPTNFDKRHDLSVTGMYQISKRWKLSANFVYASGIPATFPEGRYEFAGLVVPQFEGRNQDRLPDYHRLDISATFQGKRPLAKGGHEWTFGFYNIYNRANATSIYFVENEENPGETQAFQSYLFGITPTITYNFKF